MLLDKDLTLTILVLIVVFSLATIAFFLHLQRGMWDVHVLNVESTKITKDSEKAEIELFTLYRMIEGNKVSDQFQINALIGYHAINCTKVKCLCEKVLGKVDNVRQIKNRIR